MPYYAPERHRRILQLQKEAGRLRSAELEKILGVTAMTVWRDLKLLEEQGQLRRVRGGAVPIDSEGELAYVVKSDRARSEKQQIAAYVAAHCIEEGDTLILDGGTTIASLEHEPLPGKLTILTNSLPVAQAMMRHPSTPAVYLCGGLLRPESGTLVGREAITFFSRRRVAKFLMSATAVDLKEGITDPNPQEIEVKQAMAARASSVILLSDPSKFGEVSLMRTLPWRRIEKLVTTGGHPLISQLREKGIEVVVA